MPSDFFGFLGLGRRAVVDLSALGSHCHLVPAGARVSVCRSGMERSRPVVDESAISGLAGGAEWNGGGLKSWRQALACGHLRDSLAFFA